MCMSPLILDIHDTTRLSPLQCSYNDDTASLIIGSMSLHSLGYFGLVILFFQVLSLEQIVRRNSGKGEITSSELP